jgi:hypothetical protein
MSIVFSCLSLCLVPLAVIGLPLGLTVLWLSTRDLRQMHAGLRDPAGAGLVRAARRSATWATGLPAVAALIWTWIVLWWGTGRLALVPLAILFGIGLALFTSEPWRAGRSRDW